MPKRRFQNFSGLIWTGPRFPQDDGSRIVRSSDSCIRIIYSLFSESLPSLEVALNDCEMFRFRGAKVLLEPVYVIKNPKGGRNILRRLEENTNICVIFSKTLSWMPDGDFSLIDVFYQKLHTSKRR